MLNYYAIVGLRPIPVILPFLTLWKKYGGTFRKASINLIVTKKSREVAEKVKNFLAGLEKDFYIELTSFDEFLDHLRARKLPPASYLNLTTGMNWQIAKTILLLPENQDITLLYQDFMYLYRIKPDNYENAFKEREQLVDIGLENYMSLIENLSFIKQKKMKFPYVQQKLSVDHVYEIVPDNQTFFRRFFDKKELSNIDERYQKIINYIFSDIIKVLNSILFYVKERSGLLYLYFVTNFDSNRKKFHRFYRTLLTLFPVHDYGLVLYFYNSSKDPFIEREIDSYLNRCRGDGIYATKSFNVFRRWFEDPPLPFKVKPTRESFTVHSAHLPRHPKRIAVYCLGENIIPTIETTLNWRDAPLHLILYDQESERIKYLKGKFEYQFVHSVRKGEFSFFFLGTDHLGTDSITAIRRFIEVNFGNHQPELNINITPGTKAQTICLTLLAKYAGLPCQVFSYETRSRKFLNLIDSSVAKDLSHNFSLPQLLSFYYTTYQTDTATQQLIADNIDLLEFLMNKLISGEYIILNAKEIICKKLNKNALFIEQGGEYNHINLLEYDENGKVKNIRRGKLSRKIEDVAARLWELMVFYHIKKMKIVPKNSILYSLKWIDKETVTYQSEKDIVFIYKDYPVAIDCTISRSPDRIIQKVIHNRGDNSRRFTRFAINIIAIPALQISFAPLLRDTAIFTLRELRDRETFLRSLDSLVSRLRTYS